MEFSEQELQLINRMFQYWLDNWDWECPTLFGVSKEHFKRLVENANENTNLQIQELQNIIVAGIRELFYGASAITPNKYKNVTGFDTSKTEELVKAVLSKYSEE